MMLFLIVCPLKKKKKKKYKEFIIDGELSSGLFRNFNFFYSFDNMEKKVKIDSCKIKKVKV